MSSGKRSNGNPVLLIAVPTLIFLVVGAILFTFRNHQIQAAQEQTSAVIAQQRQEYERFVAAQKSYAPGTREHLVATCMRGKANAAFQANSELVLRKWGDWQAEVPLWRLFGPKARPPDPDQFRNQLRPFDESQWKVQCWTETAAPLEPPVR